jgi:uncharacterized protein YxjI
MTSVRNLYVIGICSFIHFIYSLPPIKGERRINVKGHVVTIPKTFEIIKRANHARSQLENEEVVYKQRTEISAI